MISAMEGDVEGLTEPQQGDLVEDVESFFIRIMLASVTCNPEFSVI